MKRFCIVLVLQIITTLSFGQKQITIDDLTKLRTFEQKAVRGISWMKDGRSYTTLSDNKILRHDATTGAVVGAIFDGDAQQPQILIDGYSFNKDESALLIATSYESIYRRSSKAEYYFVSLSRPGLKRVSTGGKQSYATFSPDGTRIAFVRNNNLFFVDTGSWNEVQLTSDGKFNYIINGSTDWVYEEELSFAKAFEWSPDGNRIAYYRFDESLVKEYNLQKWNKGALYPTDYRYKYPKAGEKNSVVGILIYDFNAKSIIKADVGQDTDIYIPRIMWTADPNVLSVRRLNRLQNQLDILHVDAATGRSTIALSEKNDAWYDIDYTDELIYLAGGQQFLFSSERSGNKHFYLSSMDGSKIVPVTSGEWEATALAGIDERAKLLYYLSTEGNHLERNLYSISFDGKKKVRLSAQTGTHAIDMSPNAQYFIDSYSSATQPLQVSLYRTKGNTAITTLEANDQLKARTKEYGIQDREFFKYTSADEITMIDGYVLKPASFDPTKKYPLMVFQYSGPRSNSVSNSYGANANFFWHHMLAQKGVLVAVIDTRGTGGRGEKFTKQIYKQLGKLETEDLAEATKYFKTLNYVDGERLGIWGWSYGGYTTALVMTKKPGAYKLGIAGAPVTTWRYYDNIYTERFLQRPIDNPSGYDDNSPITYAGNLTGKFLLIHGTGDDNVHFQNSVAFEDALISAGKQFRSHFYPDQAHGFKGDAVNAHRFALMTEFILANL
jgi:dipeptidyl-peptidase-4